MKVMHLLAKQDLLIQMVDQYEDYLRKLYQQQFVIRKQLGVVHLLRMVL
jgi:hypothetical protein